MTERHMARLTTIDDIYPIENADRIEVAVIGGWGVVVGKGEFNVGDDVVYFEIDSALPLDDPRFKFLEPRGSKVIDGFRYHVLKTIRLRKQYSQGLILPAKDFSTEIETVQDYPAATLSEAIGVFKYEPPVPAILGGTPKGNFPADVQKTDAERVQNIRPVNYSRMRDHYQWVATEKIDGTSLTAVMREDGLEIASRNWLLSEPEEDDVSQYNVYWKAAKKFDLEHKMPVGMVVQGEVYGEGIQSNRLGVRGLHLAVFRVLQDGTDLPREEWPDWAKTIAAPVYVGLELPETIQEAVEQADGIKSIVSPDRLAEGIVWHTVDGSVPVEIGRTGFKAISNKYLVKTGE